MSHKVCAVIVSYNEPEQLHACIRSALTQVDKIIVIDNNSDEECKKKVSKITSQYRVEILYNNMNKGLGHAFNQGIRFSLEREYAWTILLDQDSVLGDKMIHEMLCSHNSLNEIDKNKVALLVPRIFEKNFQSELRPIVTSNFLNKKIAGVIGDAYIHFQISSGTMLKSDLLSSVGLMNEKLFIDYIDFDFCFRVLNSGFKILSIRNAYLYHTLGEVRKLLFFTFREHSAMRVYYQTRNRLLIIRKYGVKYRSVGYSESVKLCLKLLKIIFLESQKLEKLKCYFNGISDGAKSCKEKYLSV